MCPVHRKEGGQEVWASKGPHGQDFGLEIPPDQQEYLNMADSSGTVCVSECWRGKRERERGGCRMNSVVTHMRVLILSIYQNTHNIASICKYLQ